jgi:rfaE bifunctional protein nucleotidyltransferase chain/domain
MEGGALRAVKQKMVSVENAVRIASKSRKKGHSIVTTNGAFDLLHSGHVDSLVRAKALGDILIVGVNSDASVRRDKGLSRPILGVHERAFMVAALGCVDYVFIFGSDTPIPWLKKIRPNIHAKGSDRAMAKIVERATVESHGGQIILLPHTGRHSTTTLIERIQRGRKPVSK